jgi:hypothetical protein
MGFDDCTLEERQLASPRNPKPAFLSPTLLDVKLETIKLPARNDTKRASRSRELCYK